MITNEHHAEEKNSSEETVSLSINSNFDTKPTLTTRSLPSSTVSNIIKDSKTSFNKAFENLSPMNQSITGYCSFEKYTSTTSFILGCLLLIIGTIEILQVWYPSTSKSNSKLETQRNIIHPTIPFPSNMMENNTYIYNAPARLAVIAGHSENGLFVKDPSWLLLWNPDICILVYDHADNDSKSPRKISPNIGREGPVFTSFIVDHYYNLPTNTLFLHGDRKSWHDKDLAIVLRYLNWNLPYANLNYASKYILAKGKDPGLEIRYNMIAAAWPNVFEPWFGPLPPYFVIHCCAQFMVSRERIHAVPITFWRSYLAWMSIPLGDSAAEIDRSILVEHMWPYLLNLPPSKNAWDIDISNDPDAEFCKILTTCPLPSEPQPIDEELRQHLKTNYPCVPNM